MANSSIVPHTLDDYFQSTPIGSVDKAIINNIYGVNHRQIPGMVATNKDLYGLTFFVRPQLNLQADNIRNLRQFMPLLTETANSIQRFVRTSLDPRLVAGYTAYGRGGGDVANGLTTVQNNSVRGISCPVMDNQQAFFPVLSNNLVSISGWPDITLQSFTSTGGLYNESYSQVDSVVRNYESFDIDATFKNTRGDPILYLFYIWLYYSSNVFEGRLMPYLDFVTENEIDYMTRIYRLVLDPQRDVVRKIAATGVSYPVSIPLGSFFDYTTEKPYNDQNKDITIRFKCLGAEYLDDILIQEFNETVAIFNPSMSDRNRNRDMVKVDKVLLSYFNNRGYARIDPSTNKLEWWVSKQYFQNRTGGFFNTGLLNEDTILERIGV
jgi:hypothetical protein